MEEEIHEAARNNRDALEPWIMRFGEKVLEVKDSDGSTALHFAAAYNRNSLKLLIEKFPEQVKNLFYVEKSIR